MDAITQEIVSHLEHLPIEKKLAVLELVKPSKKSQPNSQSSWQERWSAMPVLCESDIIALEKIHEEWNSWEPQSW